MKRHPSQTGFTLVEIAIVLVLVGLLLGAALKGKELLFNSNVKATFNMSREFTAAINGYRDRYQAIPGDDGSAAARFPMYAPAPVNGNGDGWINWQAFPCAESTHGENCQVFLHLRAGGFVTGNGAETAKTPFGGQTAITASGQLHPGTGRDPVLALQNSGVTHRAAQAIDTLFDDGDPTRGTFRCRSLAVYNPSTPEAVVPDWCSIQM